MAVRIHVKDARALRFAKGDRVYFQVRELARIAPERLEASRQGSKQ